MTPQDDKGRVDENESRGDSKVLHQPDAAKVKARRLVKPAADIPELPLLFSDRKRPAD